MTQDKIVELMKPRYKVTNTFWDSPFKVGQIIEMTGKSKRFPLFGDNNVEDWETWIDGEDGGSTCYSISKFRDYPHLFKRLEWWEERDVKDIEAIKYMVWNCPSSSKSYFEVIKLDFKRSVAIWNNQGYGPPLAECAPCLESEYKQYRKEMEEKWNSV